MKQKFIRLFGITSFFCINLFAIDGLHDGLKSVWVNGGAICVYCHTPHAANGENEGPKPLWNKRSTTAVFDLYGATMAGNTVNTLTYTSASCLSCHDGVSAMNSVINAPGSGNQGIYSLDPADSSSVLLNSLGDPTNRKVMTNTFLAVGFDGLTNDHPISIVYNEGTASLRSKETILSTTNSTGTEWLGAIKIKDLLRGPDRNRVECSSCHDPHDSYFGMYRRINNKNSELCFGCHDK